MNVEYRTGDLFAQTDLGALGHGVNCTGVMGSGIAPEFRRRLPDMYEAYRRECLEGRLTVGGVFPYPLPNGRWIYNLASQNRPGKDARLDAIESSLRAALDHAAAYDVASIGLPRIGAGIGGLRWDDVRVVIEKVATHSRVTVVVVSLPGTV